MNKVWRTEGELRTEHLEADMVNTSHKDLGSATSTAGLFGLRALGDLLLRQAG